MRRFSTGRYIDQEELELWTLPGWFPALGKPGFPQIPQLRRLGVINGIPETDRLQIPTPERGPGPEAGITAGYAPVWGRRNRKPPTDSAEEAHFGVTAHEQMDCRRDRPSRTCRVCSLPGFQLSLAQAARPGGSLGDNELHRPRC